ncbi:MAG: domain S-box protein, partial [Pedosphaera sp.]|nr:domain S-box protein [Pedosphaera sp.]
MVPGNLPGSISAFNLSSSYDYGMTARNSNLAKRFGHAEPDKPRRVFRFAQYQSTILRYAVSIVSVLLVIAILKALNPLLADKHPYTLFFAAVAVTSWFAGFWPSILTILLSYPAAYWFFIPPRYSLNHGADDLAGLGGFIVSGLAIAFTSRALHAARERAETKQEELVKAKAKLNDYAATLESKVEERTADLRESLQSLEKVLYHVAHDLRAPLRAMQSFTLLLEENARHLDAEGRDYAHRVVEATSRMDVLIRDLLVYGRLGHVKLSIQRVDTERVLDDALNQLSDETAAKGAAMLIRRPLPPVMANKTVLRQVLINLLSNALIYVAPGIAPRIEIWAETDDHKVRLSVKDNGTGMRPEYHKKVFEVFERLQQRAEDASGTGMGLAIVSKGVQRMKG